MKLRALLLAAALALPQAAHANANESDRQTLTQAVDKREASLAAMSREL